MIKKFEEFVNERMFGGAQVRNKGKERLEDNQSNLVDMKGIDLGFDFEIADRDFEYKDSEWFNYCDLAGLIPYINKHGWDVMKEEDFMQMKGKVAIFPVDDGHGNTSSARLENIVNPKYEGVCVTFDKFPERYWMRNKIGETFPTMFVLYTNGKVRANSDIVVHEGVAYPVRLIRRKK